MKLLSLSAAALLLAGAAGTASANAFDADFSLGYSRLRIDGANAKDLDKSDGAAFQFQFMAPAPQTPSFRFGFSLEGSGYRNDFHVLDTNTGRDRHVFDQVSLVVPEFRIGYYVPIGGFFIEPSVGVGLAVGDYATGHVHRNYHNDYEYDDIDSDTVRANAAIHPTLQVGYSWGHIAVGLQASYLYTHLHFKDGIGGDVSEMYGGAFFRWSF